MALYKNSNFKYCDTVDFKGTIITFFRDVSDGQIYYDYLELKGTESVDDQSWAGYLPLNFSLPDEKETLRPLGTQLIQVDREVTGADDNGAFQALSDDNYIYLFRGSNENSIYLNRFVFATEVDQGADGGSRKVLLPTWEVRYKHSGLRDTPANIRDTQDYRGPTGEPFIEPTLEIPYIYNRDEDGSWAVLLIPTDVPNRNRWQFFWVTKGYRAQLSNLSFLQDDDGLMSLEGVDQSKIQQLRFVTSEGGLNKIYNKISAIYYQQQEDYTPQGQGQIDGQDENTKVETQGRIMFACAGDTSNSSGGKDRTPLFVLDLGVGFDGNLVKFPDDSFKLPPVTVGGGGEDGTDTFSNDYEDDQGLPINSWMMNLNEVDGSTVVMGENPDLLSSADGKIHLYFNDSNDNSSLKVVHYDAIQKREFFQVNWESTSKYSLNDNGTKLSGKVNFVISNFHSCQADDEVMITPTTATIGGYSYPVSFMYDVKDNITYDCRTTDDDGNVIDKKPIDKSETWCAIPYDLGLFVGTLNGMAIDDVQSSQLLNGKGAFYDYFKNQNLYVFNSQSSEGDSANGGGGIVSCMDNRQASNDIDNFFPSLEEDGDQWKLTLKQNIRDNDGECLFTLNEVWPNLSNDSQKLLNILNGTDPGYEYTNKVSVSGQGVARLYTDPSQQRGLWFIAHSDQLSTDTELDKIKITIEDTETNDPEQEQCKVIIEMMQTNAPDKPIRTHWNNVPRQADLFNKHFQNETSLSENQEKVLKIITPYATGTENIANVILHRPASLAGGSILCTAVNYGGKGKIQKTNSSEYNAAHDEPEEGDDPKAIALILVNQGRELSVDLKRSLSNYYDTIPKHSGLFNVVCESFPEDGYPAKIMPTANPKDPTKWFNMDQMGKWMSVPDNYVLKIDQTDNNNGNGFSTSDSKIVPLTGEMGMEAWVKMPSATNDKQMLTVVKEEDAYGGYSLVVKTNLENDSSGKERLHLDIIATSADSKGTSKKHTYKTESSNQWKHIAAMHESGFYVDLTPDQKPDSSSEPEQLFLDAGTEAIMGSPNDFTVETMCFIKKNDTEQVIASQWGETSDKQAWRLYVNPDNKLCFDVVRDDGSINYLKVDNKTFNQEQENTWKHIAAVYSTRAVTKLGLDLSEGNNYIQLNQDFPSEEYTCEFWFHLEDMDKGYDLCGIDKMSDAGTQVVSFYIKNRTLSVASSYMPGDDDVNILTFPEGWPELNHFAATYSKNGYISVYINGILEKAPISTKDWNNGNYSIKNNRWRIADAEKQQRIFKGFITDVRVWTLERTREEIALSMAKQLTADENGLWCYLPLDDFNNKNLTEKVGEVPVSMYSGSSLKYTNKSFAYLYQSIYVDGKLEGFRKISDGAIAYTTSPILFGKDVAGSALSGGLDGIRLWDTPRPNWAIDLYRMNNLDSTFRLEKANKKGLLADWAFRDMDGTVATDRVYNLPLIVRSMQTDKETKLSPSDFYFANYYRAQWHIYLDGVTLSVKQSKIDTISTVTKPNNAENDPSNEFRLGESQCIGSAYLDDVRLWGGMRTAEQVRDNMYRRLNSDETNLSAYWMFGDFLLEKEANHDPKKVNYGADYSENGHTLNITQTDVKEDKTVPIGDEHPVVQNAMGGVKKPQNAELTRSMSVIEYSDVEQDFDGNLFAVLKRAYVFADKDKKGINLVSGFKVDNLEMIYLGMAQTQPTLIGYLEGPPPVPSENLTRPYWRRFDSDEYARYNDACSIQLTETLDTSYYYSSQKGSPAVSSLDVKAGYAQTGENKMELPVYLIMTHIPLAKGEFKIGAQFKFSESSGTPKSLSKSVSLSKHLTEKMTLQGGWEPLSQLAADGKDLGDRRFIPANKGYALVKSSTANVYLLRLKRTKTVMNTALVPNPDTPEDWNIITFPINPKYVKNGTLDGRVGFRSDPDYRHTSERDLVYNEQENSYFKPREAYAIKQRIEREEKRLAAFYERINQRYIGKEVMTSTALRGLGNTDNEQNVPDAPGYDWDKKLSKRNLVNTYVWSADLGFFAEENQTMDMREESLGASYGLNQEGGIYSSTTAMFGTGVLHGVSAEGNALFGKNLNVSIVKNKEESDSFGMEVGVTADDLLNKWLGVDPNKILEPGTSLDPKYQEMDGYSLGAEPGKVQSYRFMSFYLAPHEKNWNDFFKKVVDPAWLRNSNDPDARALREATPHKNGVWRVMHRVTYVNRVPPPYLNAPVEELDDPANVPANLEDNTIIIDLVKAALKSMNGEGGVSVNVNEPTRSNIGDAVYHVLGYENKVGTINNTYSWWKAYWKPKSLTPEQQAIRKNITDYMFKYYETVPMSVIAQEISAEKEIASRNTFPKGDGKSFHKQENGNIVTGSQTITINQDAVSIMVTGYVLSGTEEYVTIIDSNGKTVCKMSGFSPAGTHLRVLGPVSFTPSGNGTYTVILTDGASILRTESKVAHDGKDYMETFTFLTNNEEPNGVDLKFNNLHVNIDVNS